MNPEEGWHLSNLQTLQDTLFEAMSGGRGKVRLELDVRAWLEILQEVRDRCPRNYSRLLANEQHERMEVMIDRLHTEWLALVAAGAGTIASRFERVLSKNTVAR